MNETILIAIISAGSALVGGLIPTIITYLNNKEQNQFELKKDLLNKQKEVYSEIIISLQNMINHQGTQEFKELQKAAIKLSIYGDNSSSKSMNKYYNEVTKIGQNLRTPLTKEEHKQFQLEIINGMRNNLGLDKFDNFEIVGFRQ